MQYYLMIMDIFSLVAPTGQLQASMLRGLFQRIHFLIPAELLQRILRLIGLY